MKKSKKIIFNVLIILCACINAIVIIGSSYYYHKFKEFSTVDFNSNGGTNIEKQTVKTGTTIELPSGIEKLGFEFFGWELNGEIVYSPIIVNKNIELVAKWKSIKVNTYAVKFYNEDGTLYSRQLVKENSLAYSPKKPFKSGYTFEYWSHNGEEFNFDTKINNDIQLYPVFKEKIIEDDYKDIIDEGYDQEIIED